MSKNRENLTPIESIRKRPQMYVGNIDFFGIIHYMVCPVALLLSHRPSRISVTAENGEFAVESDFPLPIVETPNGELLSFLTHDVKDEVTSYEGIVLNALSERLIVEIQHEKRRETLSFHRGVFESRHLDSKVDGPVCTTLRFVPDSSILTLSNLSPAIFKSYLRRLSYLHGGVRFSLQLGDESHEYHAARGIVDLFDQVAAPYQILHEPIHFRAEDGTLKLEGILAFHSWKENRLLCFINHGRAAEGGTHEEGLADALVQLQETYLSARPQAHRRNGVLAILFMQYPKVIWSGCIKAHVSNPELREMVSGLVVKGTTDWLEARPDVTRELQLIQTFEFPDAWSK